MTNRDVTIRPFEAATDIEPLSDIWLEASRRAHPFIGEQRLLAQRGLVKEKYLPEAETWVACRCGDPVGFISLLGSFIGAVFVAHELAHFGAAAKNGLQTGVPVPLPSLQLGLFGCITRLRGLAPNRQVR